MRKYLSVLVLIIVLFSAVGCETVKGTAKGARDGFKRDIDGIKGHECPLYKWDAWFREHMW